MPALPPTALRWSCDPASLDFETTADLEPIEGVVGQGEAVEALRFGLEIDAPGQNVFVCGLSGTGRLTLVRDHLRTLDTRRPRADDHLYVHHFETPDRPRLLTVPRGTGRELIAALERLCRFITNDLPSIIDPVSREMLCCSSHKSSDQAINQSLPVSMFSFGRSVQNLKRFVQSPTLDRHFSSF